MIWSSFAEFIAMNGYGPYVWGSFVVTFILFFLEYRQLKSLLLRLRYLQE